MGDASAKGPLSDLLVVEMGQLIAGPFCGQLLGDMGADVRIGKIAQRVVMASIADETPREKVAQMRGWILDLFEPIRDQHCDTFSI